MRTAALNQFCLWIEDSTLSQTIQVSDLIVPITQIIHIFAVATVLTVCLLIALRLFGYYAREFPLSHTFGKYWPVFKIALLVLLLSGATLIIGEPTRSLANGSFQLKMILLLAVILNLLFIKKLLIQKPTDWTASIGVTSHVTLLGKFLASSLLILLILIVFAGRWIAYS
jgi:hypothetical protein